MLKITKEEFVEELQAELYGYEEIEEELIQDFMKRLEEFFAKKKSKKVVYGKEVMVKLKDESDLFMVADRFLAAVTSDEVDKYWEDFDI